MNLQGELIIKNPSTGSTVFIADTNGNVDQTGLTNYYNAGDILSTNPQFSVGMSSGNFVIHDNITGVDSMSINATSGAITFDPPVGGGGSWVGTATSPLNMNAFPIINATSITATNFNGNLNGVASSAVSANQALGLYAASAPTANSIVLQSGTSSTSYLAPGTTGTVLTTNASGGLEWDASIVPGAGVLTMSTGGHLTGSASFSANQPTGSPVSFTVSSDATTAATAGTLVARDSNASFSANVITANLNGTATQSTTSTNLSGGTAGNIPWQSGSGTTGFIPTGSAGSILQANGTSVPTWVAAPSVGNANLSISTANHASGSGSISMNQSSPDVSIVIQTDGTSSNTPSTLVARDSTGNFTCGTITGNLSGTASSATAATNLTGGLGGQIPYQSSVNTTAFLPNGTAGQILTSQGTTLAPTWSNAPTVNNGTLSFTSGAHVTISGGNFTANQATNTTENITLDATTNNTLGTIVARDSSTGGFSSGPVNTNQVVYTGNISLTPTSGNLNLTTGNLDLAGGQITSASNITPTLNTVLNLNNNGTSGVNINTSGVPRISVNGVNGNTTITNLTPTVLQDSTGSSGTSGYYLKNTGSGATSWAAAPSYVSQLQVAATTSAGTYYPIFTSSLGSPNTVNGDNTSGHFSYNANSGTLVTLNNTVGSNVSCSNVIVSKNISLSGTFADASSSVGSSGQVLSSTGTGTAWVTNSASNVNITNSTSSATLYPTFVSSTGSQAVDIDNASGHFTYQPSTGTLTTMVLDCPTINGGSTTTINGGLYDTDIITNTGYGTINLKAGTTTYFSLSGGLGTPYLNMTPSLTSSLNINCVIPFLGGTTLGRIYADSSTLPLTYNPSTSTLNTNILQTPTISAGTVALTIQGGSSAPINTYFGSSTGGAFNVRAGTPSSYTDVFNITGGIGLNAVTILPQSATGSTSSYKVPIISPTNVFSNDGSALNYLPSTETLACPNLIVSGSVSIGGNPSFQLYGYTNNAFVGTYAGQQVLVQMGYYSGTTNTSAKLAVNFPTPFPNGVMKIIPDNNLSSSSATTIYEDYYVGGTATLSGFTISCWSQSTSGGTRTYRTSQSVSGYYTAYGW